jgi:hypothetical protein
MIWNLLISLGKIMDATSFLMGGTIKKIGQLSIFLFHLLKA